MLKRIFLLALAVAAGWIAWRWLRQRAEDFSGVTPEFSSIEPPAPTMPAQPGPTPWSAPPEWAATPPIVAPPAELVTNAAGPGEQVEPPDAGVAGEPAGTGAEADEEPGAASARPIERAPEEAAEETGVSSASIVAPVVAEETAEEPGVAEEAVEEMGAPAAGTVETAPGEVVEEPSASIVAPALAPGDHADDQTVAVGSLAEQAPAEGIDSDEIVGYCVRCKTKRQIAGAHEETTESGRRAARGTCPVCGANMFTFLATE